MKRTVIKIDENICNGCGNCVTGCHEGALKLIGGKAVMISDLYCDGLGACIGECPVGAITFEEREAQSYDEKAVMKRLAPKGEAAIRAHLKHLKDHNEHKWLRQGIEYINKHDLAINLSGMEAPEDGGTGKPGTGPGHRINVGKDSDNPAPRGCPGTMSREIKMPFAVPDQKVSPTTVQRSELSQFPVQLHLLNPQAGFLQGADLLLAADCTAFASGEFHNRFLKGKALAIACPKLDSNTQVYVDKLVQMIDQARIETLTVLVMEVPCCSGLVRIAQLAREHARRNIPAKVIVLSVDGNVKSEEWI